MARRAGWHFILLGAVLAAASPPTDAPVPQLPETTLRVPVADAQMALFVSGAGRPAIVMEAGSGGDHRTWQPVRPALARLGRVVTYDRLGFGSSAASRRPRSAAHYVQELREGLRKAGIAPPYLLVGHSFGGAIVRLFASQYPDEVFGLVLVDPAMEGVYLRAPVEAPEAYLRQLEEDLAAADAGAGETLKREYLAYETSMQQVRAATPPPGDRIILLSATEMEVAEPLRAIWLGEQARWARKVGATRIAVDSGHHIHKHRPEAVVDAVRQLIERGR